jgi:hypothetical protein
VCLFFRQRKKQRISIPPQATHDNQVPNLGDCLLNSIKRSDIKAIEMFMKTIMMDDFERSQKDTDWVNLSKIFNFFLRDSKKFKNFAKDRLDNELLDNGLSKDPYFQSFMASKYLAIFNEVLLRGKVLQNKFTKQDIEEFQAIRKVKRLKVEASEKQKNLKSRLSAH